jgi:hypothetical protein
MLNPKTTSCNTQKNGDIPASRRLYQKPRLQELGDLRTLTLGGSPGNGDSGGGFLVENPRGSGFAPLLPPEY